jgi:hypothetical protein
MARRKMTGRKAVWTGLLATPALIVAAVTLVGVTAGSAGPTTSAAPSATSQANGVVTVVNTQSLDEVKAYWTAERMASARPHPAELKAESAGTDGHVQSIPVADAPFVGLMMQANGTATQRSLEAASSPGALTEPFHGPIPYTQFQWFGRYLRNTGAGSPNLPISAQHKLFFTQNGLNFVCSSSSIGPDAAWTAGHCLSDGSSTFSTNMLMCPSYDSAQGGVNPTAGCWSWDSATVNSTWHTTGDLDYDFGGINADNVGTTQAMMIGNYTGWLGLGLCQTNAMCAFNIHWLAFGYPQAAPFTGGKIETCASSFGYVDAATAGGLDSWAMGCDMTGGSSGGPWVYQFGRFGGQPGGDALNWIVGHNDWRHTAVPDELNSPAYNCRVIPIYNAINGTSFTCP